MSVLKVTQIVTLLLATISIVPPEVKAATPISICELARYDSRENGNIIRIQGVYVSDLVERTVLTDPTCPSVSAVVLSPDSKHHESVGEFERAVRGDVVHDTELREFYIDASVIYRWKNASSSQVELIKVWNFHSVRR